MLPHKNGTQSKQTRAQKTSLPMVPSFSMTPKMQAYFSALDAQLSKSRLSLAEIKKELDLKLSDVPQASTPLSVVGASVQPDRPDRKKDPQRKASTTIGNIDVFKLFSYLALLTPSLSSTPKRLPERISSVSIETDPLARVQAAMDSTAKLRRSYEEKFRRLNAAVKAGSVDKNDPAVIALYQDLRQGITRLNKVEQNLKKTENRMMLFLKNRQTLLLAPAMRKSSLSRELSLVELQKSRATHRRTKSASARVQPLLNSSYGNRIPAMGAGRKM